jgi:hypothetical protein
MKILGKQKKAESKYMIRKIEIQAQINKRLIQIKTRNRMKNNPKNFSVQDSKSKG